MAQKDYQTLTLALDTDFAASSTNRIQLVPSGRRITNIRVGLVTPATTPFRLHLGQKDPIDVFQGDAFVDDGGVDYDGGLSYSQLSAPVAGARANVTVFFN